MADADDEVALVARILGANCRILGEGRFAALARDSDDTALADRVHAEIAGLWRYRDPFDRAPLSPQEAVSLLAHWRTTIHANRKLHAVLGVARWKRAGLDPLLWDGTGPVRHGRRALARLTRPSRSSPNLRGTGQVAAWRTRCPPRLLAGLEHSGLHLTELEDGFIRSNGLGANCVPPLSLVLDPLGAHFDPARPSALETLLQSAEVSPAMSERAGRLREQIVTAGIGKYGAETALSRAADRTSEDLPCSARRIVLVAGQVDDDRALVCAGAGLDNLALLRQARRAEPQAHLVYRPHPDVEAGHRKGALAPSQVLRWADAVDSKTPLAALLQRVDAVHVISSLTGFEALLRGCAVVTHGVPFYAGWGLTRDLGPVPARRERRRTLDELVAFALILYPRYLDPMTRLPCSPEVLVARIAAQAAPACGPLAGGALVTLRRAQGALQRLLTRAPGLARALAAGARP